MPSSSPSSYPTMFANHPTRPPHAQFIRAHNAPIGNATYLSVQQGGMIRLTIECLHGRVMLGSTIGLNFISAPNVSTETTRQDSFPAPIAPVPFLTESRFVYQGADGSSGTSGTSSGAPQQMWWKRVTVEGCLGDINMALGVVTYWPDLNWNSGLELIDSAVAAVSSVTSSANGTYGTARGLGEMEFVTFTAVHVLNTSLATSNTIRVRVRAVNDAPVLSLPGQIYADGSTAVADLIANLTFNPHLTVLTGDMLSPIVVDVVSVFTSEDQPVEIVGVSVRDVDCSTQNYLMVTLTATHGSVSLNLPVVDILSSFTNSPATTGLTFLSGTGAGDTISSFIGSIATINNALQVLTFTPALHYFGVDARLNIAVQDLGNTGIGGEQMDTQTVRIMVLPVNTPPTVLVPGDFGGALYYMLNEGTGVDVNGARFIPPKSPLLNADGTLSQDGSNNLWQSGFEPWRFVETLPVNMSNSVVVKNAAGYFDWNRREYADIQVIISSQQSQSYVSP